MKDQGEASSCVVHTNPMSNKSNVAQICEVVQRYSDGSEHARFP